MNRAHPSPSNRDIGPVAGGAFLACSWTWCIGMFLPVLLIGDFGWPAFLVFAIPNMLGAAAMGAVLRSSAHAAAFRERRLRACVCFSWITIAFHVFFLSWIAVDFLSLPPIYLNRAEQPLLLDVYSIISGPAVLAPLFAGGAYIAALAFCGMRWRRWVRLAPLLWIASIALCAVAFTGAAYDGLLAPPSWGVSSSTGLLWLAPVCIFGFALCPYLDLTFLRTRIELEGAAGRNAFLAGFLGFFPVMIGLTLLYAGRLVFEWSLSGLIIAHLMMQSIYTMGVHLHELRRAPWPASRLQRALTLAAPLALAAVPIALKDDLWNDDAYRVFMGAYGLLFPA
ncbi:MAG: hypothetical protein VYC34_06315, partial [Planctomycetota bacterium]|nr:hypothetical protein [Planctomycetota bacterium]